MNRMGSVAQPEDNTPRKSAPSHNSPQTTACNESRQTPRGSEPKSLLDSWKEIAQFLGRDVRTAQRWERKEDLPIHRHIHKRNGSVYAFTGELDAWRKSRTLPALGMPTQEPAAEGPVPHAKECPRPADCARRARILEKATWKWMNRGEQTLVLCFSAGLFAPAVLNFTSPPRPFSQDIADGIG